MLFGWIGGGGGAGGDDDDSYLLKTPGRVTAAAAGHEKASKRASMRDLFVSSRIPPHKDKDQSMFHVL